MPLDIRKIYELGAYAKIGKDSSKDVKVLVKELGLNKGKVVHNIVHSNKSKLNNILYESKTNFKDISGDMFNKCSVLSEALTFVKSSPQWKVYITSDTTIRSLDYKTHKVDFLLVY